MSKQHYVYRNREWWVFPSLAVAREFLSTARVPGKYQIALEPLRIKRPAFVHADGPY